MSTSNPKNTSVLQDFISSSDSDQICEVDENINYYNSFIGQNKEEQNGGPQKAEENYQTSYSEEDEEEESCNAQQSVTPPFEVIVPNNHFFKADQEAKTELLQLHIMKTSPLQSPQNQMHFGFKQNQFGQSENL